MTREHPRFACVTVLACAVACAAGGATGCRSRRTLPPYGQALLVVDTDLPVPAVVTGLRVDVFSPDGTWRDTSDFALGDPSKWPASFSVYTPSEAETTALVRLRAYPEGARRDYLGERYQPPVTTGKLGSLVPDVPPPAGGAPRLVQEGADVTPSSEPQPEVTVDRLVVVPLAYGDAARRYVTLAGACAGTMADLLGQRTCIDQGGVLQAVTEESSSTSEDAGPPSQSSDASVSGSRVGTFGAGAPCTVSPRPAGMSKAGVPLYDDDTCVTGGAFRFGLTDQAVSTETVPERVAVIPSALVDRYEVTVGRWRDRVSRGFAPPSGYPVLTNDGPLPTSDKSSPPEQSFCTYSTEPLAGAESRETFPLTCLPYAAARAFCQYEGGDLLTEAEWEYAATSSGGGVKTTFPWGYDPPSCMGVVFGRDDVQEDGDTTCTMMGLPFGGQSVTKGPGDVALTSGLSGMGASVQELVRDSADPYGSVCWLEQPLVDPVCEDPDATIRSVRGGSWRYAASSLYATIRTTLPNAGVTIDVGFRCMRKGTMP